MFIGRENFYSCREYNCREEIDVVAVDKGEGRL